MLGLSNSNSLQWRTAVKTFAHVILAGIFVLTLAAYLITRQLQNGTLGLVDVAIYFSLCACLLIIVAALLAFYSHIKLAQPINNLAHITQALPLLAKKNYHDAMLELADNRDTRHYAEIGALEDATRDLAGILEQLDQEIQTRTQELNQQKEVLKSERDFVKSLLDTAQLIVVTIDRQFNVTLFNEHGETITGFQQDEILGESVGRLFPASHWTQARTLFNELLSGQIAIAQQDGELIDADDKVRQISWLHSRLNTHDSNAVLLSVGLDMTDKKEAETRIVWMAEHDPLTDLCNRRKFTEEFEKSLQTAIRYHHQNTLLYLDLDRFKDINDTSGHRAGDELLQIVAERLKRVTRFTDLIARLGGDEFAILMPESDADGAQVVAHKILKELAAIELHYGAVRHKVSASIGIVHFPLHNADIHELMGFADLAMYKAKAAGKSNYHTFSPDDDTREQLETRVFWKHQIEQALEKQLFVLHFQPIMALRYNTVEHYEVLVRMRETETDTLNLPGKFIEIAEQVGLIEQIDSFVIENAIIRLTELQREGRDVSFAINLSASMVACGKLYPLLKQLIDTYPVDPTRLIFEITENVALSNLQQAKETMMAIKALGCQFSLDDFGVGFSSFNYIRELPVDIIKIDGTFIRNLDKNADDQLFVKALVDIAHGLEHKTVAEFVENREILTLLRGFGVDYVQGFYIGRPQAELLPQTDWQSLNQA